MINLKVLILSILISLSLQDSHCLSSIEYCGGKDYEYDEDEGSSNEGGIDHCEEANGRECEECEEGFAISYEKNRCISFQNCISLEAGNNKCEECIDYFHPNSEGKCERTLCETYDANGVCQGCYGGYFLKNNQCQKITIPYCLTLDSNDETKCYNCVDISMPNNGNCIVPPTLIKGWTQYDTNGKCIVCYYGYNIKEETCVFNKCPSGQIKYEYCLVCEAGYYFDYDEGLCVGYDGTKDKNAGSITGNQNVFILILLLSLLI